MTKLYVFTGVMMVFVGAVIYTNIIVRRRTAPARLKPRAFHNEDINRGRLGDVQDYDRLMNRQS